MFKSFQYRPLIRSATLPALSAASEPVPAIDSEDPCGFYLLASSRRSSSPVHDPSIQIGWIPRTVFLETLRFRASVIVGASNRMISTCPRVFSTTGSFSTSLVLTTRRVHGYKSCGFNFVRRINTPRPAKPAAGNTNSPWPPAGAPEPVPGSARNMPDSSWRVSNRPRARPGHTVGRRYSGHPHEQRRLITTVHAQPNVSAPFGCRTAPGARAGARGS